MGVATQCKAKDRELVYIEEKRFSFSKQCCREGPGKNERKLKKFRVEASRAGKAAIGSFGVPFRRRCFSSLLSPRQQNHSSDYVVIGLFIEPCDALIQIL